MLEDCCEKKTVGSKSYTLFKSGVKVPEECNKGCAYKEDGTENIFCFSPGNLTVNCLE